MSELRRRALGGQKTVSRKARSKQPSVPTSRPNSSHGSHPGSHPGSRQGSRPASHAGSDDDDDAMSDDTNFSMNSVDELLLATEHDDVSLTQWEEDLSRCVEDLMDRNWKRSNVQTREETLTYYCRILTLRYAREAIQDRGADLIAAFLKSIKTESSEKESVLAMRALNLTTLTLQPDSIYEDAAPTIKRAIADSESVVIKTAAIYVLSVISFFGDISDEETVENLNYLLEIVSSDGGFIDADDEPTPVIAALESYGFLATLLDDLSEESHDAIEAFMDQLSSSNAPLQVAAGECIALLYEKSYSDGAESDSDSDASGGGSGAPKSNQGDESSMEKRYEAYRRTDQLESALEKLAHVSGRNMSKKDRKSLHTNFADILNSVRNPQHGPRYQTAIRADGSGAYGSRMVVRLSATGLMRIDRWWKLVRLQGLRRVLRDGFVTHYELNPVIFEALPIMIHEKQRGAGLAASKARSKHFLGGTKFLNVP